MTVDEYLASLPAEKRAAILPVLAFVRAHIPRGYEEAMNWGVISWHVPLARFPDTYNGFPLTYVALAAQKSYNSLYLMGEYGSGAQETLRARFAREGRKLDMGKSCVHFRTMEDLAPRALAESIARTPPDDYVAMYQRARR